jgi:hypothetical protein
VNVVGHVVSSSAQGTSCRVHGHTGDDHFVDCRDAGGGGRGRGNAASRCGRGVARGRGSVCARSAMAVLVGTVQVAAILLFHHTVCHDLQPIQVNTMLTCGRSMIPYVMRCWVK